ncbi:MAG: carboxypeptidase-like regulatory domain-containing protein [Acidobacteriota bacterium]
MHFRSCYILALAAAVLSAQDTRGTLLGRVADSTGAVIPGVEVRAINPATGITVRGRTNETGDYAVPYLLPGVYTVEAELAGFKRFVREGVQIRVNDAVTLDISMSPGDVTETVEVTAVTPLLETSSASVGQVIDQRRITELPIVAGNPFQLIQLSPGVLNTTNLRIRNLSAPNSTSQISTDGNAQYSNEFTIDGIPNVRTAPFEGSSLQVAFIPPTSAVSEFKIQTVSYDASLGHTPGAVINVSTTSGTNELHGELHEYFRNRVLDAKDFFQNRSGQALPVYQNNRYGFSAGGPVYLPRRYDGRNRSFWFYAHEQHRFAYPTPNTWTVPTAAQLQGDFSGLLALGPQYQIYDPYTIQPAPGGRFSRLPIPGNIIPSSRLSPVAQSLSKLWPAPSQPGTSDGRDNFFAGAQNSKNRHYQHIGRIDHAFGQNHRLFLRFHYDWFEEAKNDNFQNIANRTHHNRSNHGAALDDVIVFSPSFLLNLRYGFLHFEFPERRASRGIDLGPYGFSKNLIGLADAARVALPNTSIDGYSGFGTGPDQIVSHVTHATAANFTKLVRSHTLRFGVDFRVDRPFADDFANGVSPSLSFGTNWTRGPLDNSTSAPMGQSLASFLLGLPTGGSMSRLSGGQAMQTRFLALYLQNDYKVTSRLTLMMGLRHEYETPLTERFDRTVTEFAFSEVSPIDAQARARYAANPIPAVPVDQFRARGGLLFAGAGGRPRTFWEGDKNNFMPRLGIAFTLRPTTVIRTGYGIFFDVLGSKYQAIPSGFSQSTPVVASLDNGLSYIASLADPFPNGLLPAQGPAGGLATNLGQSVSFYPRKMINSYAQRWSFGVQHQFLREFVIDASYVGNRGTKLAATREFNPVPAHYLSALPYRDQPVIDFLTAQVRNPFAGLLPGTGLNGANVSQSQLLRPYPQFTGISSVEPSGYSWYHSLQVRGEKRFSSGYTLNLAYTWSKFMEAAAFLNATDPMPERVISTHHRTHRLVVSGIYELPFGRGCKFATHAGRFWDLLIGGWQLNAIITRQSGQPLGFGNSIFNGDLNTIPLPRSERTVDRWFNTEAGFERDTRRQLANNIRRFPSRFGGIRSDGQHMWDVSALKKFELRERVRLEFRAEAYNALNHANFNNPNTSPTSTAFARVTSQNGNPRWWQLALRLTF